MVEKKPGIVFDSTKKAIIKFSDEDVYEEFE